MNKVRVNGKEYVISPLKCKHLRKISEILSQTTEAPQGAYGEIAKWLPFILASVQVEQPNVTIEELEEMTLQDFTDIWLAITEISGYKMVKRGEMTPRESDGTSSTGGHVPPSAGDIVM
jgi:hypothetical protein